MGTGQSKLRRISQNPKTFEKFYNEEYPHDALGYRNPKEIFEESWFIQICLIFCAVFQEALQIAVNFF